MFVGSSEISINVIVKHVSNCNTLELSGLFVCLWGLIKFFFSFQFFQLMVCDLLAGWGGEGEGECQYPN